MSNTLEKLNSFKDPNNQPKPARIWSFNFTSESLKADFLRVAAARGVTAGSIVNHLIYEFLKSLNETTESEPELKPSGLVGRPAGRRNIPKVRNIPSPDPERVPTKFPEPATNSNPPARVGRPRKEKALPSPLDIQKLVLGTGSGVFPVGNIRFLTQSEKDGLATAAIQAGTSPTIAEAVYVDDLNNYFTEEFWWWNGLFFAGNAGGSKAILTEKAIQSGTYYPTDPEDYRLSKYYRDALFGKHGYLLEGNGYDRNMNFKQWMDYVIAENLDWQSPETEQDNATQG